MTLVAGTETWKVIYVTALTKDRAQVEAVKECLMDGYRVLDVASLVPQEDVPLGEPTRWRCELAVRVR